VTLPARPRLAPHVRPRRHLVDGDERFVLHDGREAVAQLGVREWVLLAQADGTRDVEGLRLAALREGVRVARSDLEAFLAALAHAGLVEEGAPRALELARADGPAPPAPEARAPRVVRALPGFRLACDGRGTCCRFYGTVLFSPVEVARARALLPLVDDAGDRPDRAFLPERGGAPTGGRAVSLVNGRCSYLEPEGACALHRVGGPLAKPLGCRTFPAALVDLGHELRVSVSYECACVEASAGGREGAPLIPEGLTELELDPSLGVASLPREVSLGAGRVATCDEVGAWLDEWGAGAPSDLVELLWGAADALARGGLGATPTPVAPRASELAPWLEALAKRAEAKAESELRYRATSDLVPLTLGFLAEGARALVGAEPRAAGAPREAAERLYLEAMVFGRAPLQEPGTLALALRARAVRVLLSRALRGAAPPSSDRAFSAPLALVEAACRGHALASFVTELGPEASAPARGGRA
jgi:lysine-N-methylase